MASTNKTTNYELSQYIGTDKPTYLGDYNSDMLKIDTAMKANATAITTAQTTAETASTNASTALTNATTAQNTADTASTTANSALTKALEVESSFNSLSFEWTLIKTFGTASGNNTSTITGIEDYDEFLVVLTPTGATGRCMNSSVIPADMFLTEADSSNGYHQVSDRERVCGVSYMGNNQLKVYTGAYSGIAVYARKK